jgi:RHS repeat-associated protein
MLMMRPTGLSTWMGWTILGMPIPSATLRGLRPLVSLRGLRGNLLSDGVRTFTYECEASLKQSERGAANRLTSVTSGTLTTTFEYDGLGNRTAQTVDGVTTEYVLDVAGGLPEVIVATTGGASMRYLQVQGQILAEYDAGAWGYVLPDHLGSVRQLVGSDSQVALAQSYDPFGVPFETSGSGESDFGYTGEWWNSEAALLYLRARYYEPAIGRFVSKDPWQGDSSRPQSLNAWSYVQGNPLNFTDPSGRIFCPYGVDPETGACNPPRWGGLVEGLPPTFAQTFAQTMAGNPASATAQVALSVLAYLYFRLADNLQPSPPPLRVGSPWEGLREWLPLGQQPNSLIPGPALGDTPEWLPAVLPGPYVDMPGTTTWVLDFRLIQPCFEDNVLLADSRSSEEIRKSIRSLEKQIAKHQEKIDKRIGFDPVSDDPVISQRAAEARLRHLQREIETFRRQIERLKQELINRGEVP